MKHPQQKQPSDWLNTMNSLLDRLRSVAFGLTGLGCLSLCSCAALTPGQSAQFDHSQFSNSGAPAQILEVQDAQPLARETATIDNSPEGAVSLGVATTATPAPHPAGRVTQVQFEIPCPEPHGRTYHGPAGVDCPHPADCEFCPNIPRIELHEAPEPNHDEFLCDGGDRGLPVHYHSGRRQGFETEDTVAEFRDHEGVFHVRATNKVCVYSPRFGAVRNVSAVNEDVAVNRLASAIRNRRGTGLHSPVGPTGHERVSPPIGIRVRTRASGTENNDLLSGLIAAQASNVHTKTQEALQRLTFVQRGEVHRAEEAYLASSIDAAAVWTRDAHPQIEARIESAQETSAIFRPQAYVAVEDEKTKGELRIVKLADRKVAQQGEIITFTIRYDNLGDRELTDVRIVDNLTTRLQFVEGSETSDRLGSFTAENNGEGSRIITFTLDEPLPGHTGGVITFQTRVR